MLNTRKIRFISSIIIAAILSVVIFAASFLNPSGFTIWVFVLSTILLFLIWEFTVFISKILDIKVPWSEGIIYRILLQLICTSLGALIIFFVPYSIYKWYSITYLEVPVENIGSYIINLLLFIGSFILILALLVTGLQLSFYFLEKWKDAQLETEIFKNESLKAKFDTLRNQIDPHLLFNNFNTIYGLIDEKPKLAKEYLLQLSEMYRYILNNRDQDIVLLKEEIKIARSYIFLLQNRYGKGLEVLWSIDNLYYNYYIPPLTIQMLIENAVKHNSIEEDFPLKIVITVKDDEYLEINNSINKRNDAPSTKLGLIQLKQRLLYLTNKKVTIKEDLDQYKVRVPLLILS